MKTTLLIEPLDLSEAVIDPMARTVRQVIIRAGKSQNRRYYSEAVLQQAASLFEGVRTYANHPSRSDLKERPERSVLDITGYLTDVLYEDGALKATRHFIGDAGDKVWRIVEQVVDKKAPASLIGASINAIGQARRDKMDGDDFTIVEAITTVHSVDDVTTPAAGGGFERLVAGGDDIAEALLAALDYDEWLTRSEFVERLKKEWKGVRLEEATKTALAEAEQRVQAATAEAGRATQALNEAQKTNTTLTQERDAALAEAGRKARELTLEQTMRQATLPKTVEDDLRERMTDADMDTWPEIIRREKAKLKQLGLETRIVVEDAGQQVDRPTDTKSTQPARVNMGNVKAPEDLEREIRRVLEASK